MPNSSGGGWLADLAAQARKSPLAAALLRVGKSKPLPVQRARTQFDEIQDEIERGDYWEANGPQGQPGRWMGKGPEPPRGDADQGE
jgi:hypothetical protein